MPNIEKAISYDDVPYPSFTFPQTHPDRLATMARLFGLKAADPKACRMLELGCGDGTNLLSFAYTMPDSKFVGLDLSKTHIDAAKAAAKDIGVSNVSFFQMDLMEFDTRREGEFDFMIAHGLLSWVPDFVREKVFEIFRDCLTHNGVGYLSYNALPGCKTRQIAWDLMRFHAAAVDDPNQKVEQGLAAIDFVANATDDEYGYQSLLRLEHKQIAARSLPNVIHDDFGEINQPFYFHEVASMLDNFGLQYLCEAEPTSMNEGPIPPETLRGLPSVVDDIVRREQYLDFIKCRRFRNTLFCRSEVRLDRLIGLKVLENFLIAAKLETGSPNAAMHDDSPVTFSAANGSSVSISHPLTKVSLAHVNSIWSQAVGFSELITTAGKLLGESGVTVADKQRTASLLLQIFFAGFVDFHLWQPEYFREVSEMPAASAFAQWQIRHESDSVTTMWGLNIDASDAFMTELLLMLDGNRNRAKLVKEIKTRIEVPEEQRASFHEALPDLIDAKLGEFAKLGLLIS